MFWQDEGTGFEHQDTPAARRVTCEQVFRNNGAESAPADHDCVELARATSNGLGAAVERFL
jgi:hypothetical protein